MREIGIFNFDYFAVDFLGDGRFSMGGKKFTLGKFTRDIANLSKGYITQLVILSGELNKTRREFYLQPENDKELSNKAQNQIHNILDFVEGVTPFCYFDIGHSREAVDEVFSDEKEKLNYMNALINVYCYLGTDVANYSTAVISFTETFMQTESRTKTDLATYAAGFFGNKDILKAIKDSNPSLEMEGVTLRPRVTQVPVIGFDDENETPFLTRRQYYGRLMDFFITELFEAMMRGHYLWKCKVCDQYFLMTTAHRQLYCGQFNPEYGTTCDHVANNRRLGRDKGLPKQKRKDNPLWVICNQRYNSIRKNKSLGKYDAATTDMAKNILDERFEHAEIDSDYAENYYVEDIQLKKIYTEALKRLGKG